MNWRPRVAGHLYIRTAVRGSGPRGIGRLLSANPGTPMRRSVSRTTDHRFLARADERPPVDRRHQQQRRDARDDEAATDAVTQNAPAHWRQGVEPKGCWTRPLESC